MFDPPHIGHIVLACEARWQLGLDEVRLVPAGNPPHRPDPWLAGSLRLELLEAGIGREDGLSVSDVELARDGEGWTVTTLRQLTHAEPNVDWWLVIGADQLAAFHTWREPDAILRLARLAVAARGDVDRGELDQLVAEVAPGRADIVQMPTVAISSSMIRDRIRAGQPVRHLVPTGVADLLAAQGVIPSPTALP